MARRKKPTAIDLFCGAGGMSLGFEQAGFEVLGAFDVEEFNINIHHRNLPNTNAVVADLATETGATLSRKGKFEAASIDVVFGGPPCQGFSIAGNRDPDDERNSMVWDFARIVKDLQPKFFVMENVGGLLAHYSKPILSSFIRRIKLAGYEIVTPIRVLDASEFGVPQRRMRTIVIGHRKGIAAPNYPTPQKGRVTVRQAINDLPYLERCDELFDEDIYAGRLNKPKSRYARILSGELADDLDLSGRKVYRLTRLTGCLRTRHSDDIVARFASTVPGYADPISRYIRLHWNRVSPTIRAGTGVERGSHTAPRPIHPKYPRCITSREAARLHSFPDWFEFHGTRWHDFRQIGNSVPPMLARAVAQQIIQQFPS